MRMSSADERSLFPLHPPASGSEVHFTKCVKRYVNCGPSSPCPLLAQADQRLRVLAHELSVAEARERDRIADGLHDEIGQLLVTLRYKLEEVSLMLSASPSPSPWRALDEARGLAGQAVAAMRSATFDLSRPLLRRAGFRSAVEGLLNEWARRSHWEVRLEGELPSEEVPEPVLAVLFRAVRELLFNIHKHAQARQVWVSLQAHPHQWTVSVVDDGQGFVRPREDRFGAEGGYGLVSIEAQMQSVGGTLSVASGRGQGTRAVISLPLPCPMADATAAPARHAGP